MIGTICKAVSGSRISGICIALVVAGLAGSAANAQADPMEALIEQLAPPPSDLALADIPDMGRKLLALRSYVRSARNIDKRWSWTESEIEAFQG